MTDNHNNADTKTPVREKKFLLAAALLFFFSGACGLVYEVVWVKILTLQFGSSAWSVSTVVTAFMAGLGLGSWWAGHKAEGIVSPFRVYAWLELGIAMFGSISLPILVHLDILIGPFYILLENHFFWFILVRFVLSFAVLMIPTFLMGASLPVLVVGIARRGTIQSTVGILYGINTLGAAMGVIAAGFFMLPWWGLWTTVWVAVAVGIFVGLSALKIDRYWSIVAIPQEKQYDITQRAPAILVLVAFMSGAVSLFYEVSWTRLLLPIVGSSTYAFSIILSTFLIGIGVGGLIVSHRWFARCHCRTMLGIFMMFSALTAMIGLFAVNKLPDLFTTLVSICHNRVWLLFLSQGALAGSLIFLPTCAIGMILPLAIVAYHRETGITGNAVGGIYAANTVGSIVGSLLAGFVCLPFLGVREAIIVAVLVSLAMALFIILLTREIPRIYRLLWTLGGVSTIAALTILNPQIDFQRLHHGFFRRILKVGPVEPPSQLLYLRHGISGTVTVYRDTNGTWMKINGKADASTGKSDMSTQYLVGHLPMFFHKNPQSACIVGLGSGATARAVASHPVQRIDVIELEPAIEEASRYFTSVNGNVLADQRVHFHLEDGRAFLHYRKETYDVIISEPSNPWFAGISAVFTTEYYQMAKKRLKPDGVFCQWIQFYEISKNTFDLMLRTLADVFPNILLFSDAKGDMICIASEKPLIYNSKQFLSKLEIPDVRTTLNRVGIENVYELLVGYAGSLPEDIPCFQTALRNTDANLCVEYRAPIEMYLGLNPKIEILDEIQYLERMNKLFFPDLSQAELMLYLANAIKKRVPQEGKGLERWILMTKDTNLKTSLKETLRECNIRWKQIEQIPSQISKAKRLINLGETNDALEILEEIIKVQPKYGEAYGLMGEIFWKSQELNSAFQCYKQAIAINPCDYVSQSNLGSLFYLEGKFKEGDFHFRQALDSNPYYLRARAVWIVLLTRANRIEESEEIYAEAHRILNDRQQRQLIQLIKEIANN